MIHMRIRVASKDEEELKRIDLIKKTKKMEKNITPEKPNQKKYSENIKPPPKFRE